MSQEAGKRLVIRGQIRKAAYEVGRQRGDGSGGGKVRRDQKPKPMYNNGTKTPGREQPVRGCLGGPHAKTWSKMHRAGS